VSSVPFRSVLIADIGATNSRVAMVGADGRPAEMRKWHGDDMPSLEAVIARYIEERDVRPEAAVLAVAAPVDGDAVTMTNRAWRFRVSDIAKRFGWRAVRAMNDFEGVAWSLPRLLPADMRTLGPTLARGNGPRVVFGPGTGLGVAALVPDGKAGIVVPTEGGHVVFGPASADEEKIFAAIRAELGYVSAEAILSGPGLARLHRAIHGRSHALTPAAITEAAHGGDKAAVATIETFVRLFGRFAGDLALTFRATGGVYAAGGVARHVGTFLDAPAFREAFENHPPYAGLLKTVSTTLITLDEPGLLGCAAAAATLR
jgi:glucokinase